MGINTLVASRVMIYVSVFSAIRGREMYLVPVYPSFPSCEADGQETRSDATFNQFKQALAIVQTNRMISRSIPIASWHFHLGLFASRRAQ